VKLRVTADIAALIVSFLVEKELPPRKPFQKKSSEIRHNVRFMRGIGKDLEKSNQLAITDGRSKVDPRVVAYPLTDFKKQPSPFLMSDGILFES